MVSPQLYRPEIAVLMSELGKGGMGKMRIKLMNALAAKGVRVDLVYGKDQGEYSLDSLDSRIRVFRLGTTHAIGGIPRMAFYLFRHRPRTLLTQRLRVTVLAHRARYFARIAVPIFVTLNTHISRALEDHPPRKRALRLKRKKRYYVGSDGLIAVSRGVADDFAGLVGMDTSQIEVAPNPVVSDDLFERARAEVNHPWFRPGEPPVVVAVGRLATQKDFPTLIRAFSRFQQQHRARLVILGEGPDREGLTELVREEGVEADVDMPGFVANPYAYVSRSQLFVLSSAWEGSPNVLVEAMAVGTPVVATDCPSGPREILEGGSIAPLVPVGDVEALAEGMITTWESPPSPEDLMASAKARYSPERSATKFMEVMGISVPPE